MKTVAPVPLPKARNLGHGKGVTPEECKAYGDARVRAALEAAVEICRKNTYTGPCLDAIKGLMP